jgi:VWFA-related protein
LTLAALAAAQVPSTPLPAATSSPTPTIKADVRQVLVPAVVTDKKGQPVSGLKESDFVVFEDEKPQHIVAFSKMFGSSLETIATDLPAVSRAAPASSRVAPISEVGSNSPAHTYLVCVDTLHSSFTNLYQARHALIKFFQGEQDEKAQYALINLGRQIEVIQDSTRDASLVLSALASKKFQHSIADSESSDIVLQADILRKMFLGEIPVANLKQQAETFITSRAERTSILTRNFQQDLKNVIAATASMPTQRTIVLISDGFNLVPGRELVGIARAYFPEDPAFRFTERDAQPQLNELLRLAQKNNVVVYALDSRGLYGPAASGLGDASHSGEARMRYTAALNEMARDEDTVAWENGSAMAQLAAATGGMYFHDNNNLLSGIRRAFNDERERYLIAYSPSNGGFDGKYRKIRVEVKDKNLRVHAKTGYWASEH